MPLHDAATAATAATAPASMQVDTNTAAAAMITPGHVIGSRRAVAEGELSHKERLLAGNAMT